MKISLRNPERGSALLTSLILMGVMSLALASYLTLVQQERYSMGRSLAWNSVLPVAEAGIEEALMQINSHDMKLLADNGWVATGAFLTKTKALGPDVWSVCISTSLPPVIVAQGFTQAPLATNQISRTVRVTTRKSPYFPRGMVAKETIDLKGFGVTVDSYNSTDPAASTAGQYDPTKRGDHGSVATNSSVKDSLNSGNAKIWGTIDTGPGGIAAIGANAVVGDKTWQGSGSKGVQPGASKDDMNVSFPDVQTPTACYSAFAPVSGIVNGTNYDYVLGDGYFLISGGKSLSGQVAVVGKAVLLVTSDIQFSGQDFLYVTPGASLELYASCPKAIFGGLGIFNTTGIPANFLYYGLPTNTTLSYAGNATVSVAVYAPQADFTLGGGGSTAIDFAGATVTRTVTMNGNFNFHCDEGLAGNKFQGWIANGWDEIATPVQTIVASNLNPTTL